jgi:YD repeat-containing protein
VRQIVDAQNGATTVSYDANGNLRMVTHPRNGLTEYTYDAMNRVETRKDPLLKIERFIYDRGGNLFQHSIDGARRARIAKTASVG